MFFFVCGVYSSSSTYDMYIYHNVSGLKYSPSGNDPSPPPIIQSYESLVFILI